jgi:hypothetical protein
VLSFFRINDPYRLVGVLVILTLICLPLFIDSPGLTLPELDSLIIGAKIAEGLSPYSQLMDSTPPLASWFYGLCDFVFGRSLTGRHIAAFIFLFLQSAFLAIVFIDKKVFAENTYLPAFLFSILTCISFDMLSLTAEIPAFGFLLLAINNLFKEIEFRVQRDETIAMLGLYISIASLFSFSYSIYLPGILLILIIFTRTSPRRYILFLVGFLLPHLILACGYYLSGTIDQLWFNFYIPSLSFYASKLIAAQSMLWLCAVPSAMLFIALFILNRQAHLTKYQLQLFQTFFLLLLIGVSKMFITDDLRPQNLLPLIPSVIFYLTHFILSIRRKKFAELSFLTLLIAIPAVAYLARYEKINTISFDKLLVNEIPSREKNTSMLVLGNNTTWYVDNKLATGFYDWRLCEEIFNAPDYYENVLLVNSSLTNDPPQHIIDPKNLMMGFFDRLPALAARYEKTAVGYSLKKN